MTSVSSQSSCILPNCNFEIQLHQIKGTNDFCGYVITSRVSSTGDSSNARTSETGESLASNDGIKRIEAEAYICNGMVHLSVKAQNVLPQIVDDYGEAFAIEIGGDDDDLHRCVSHRSIIRQLRDEGPIDTDSQKRAAEDSNIPSSVFTETANDDNEDGEVSSSTSELSELSDILLPLRSESPLSYGD